jgi:hypothetical protein
LGACVGAGVVLWLAPRGRRAYEHYRQAGVQVGEAVDELMRKGQGIRDEVAEVVAHAAHAVERAATAAKS